jgi:hypothetical protein
MWYNGTSVVTKNIHRAFVIITPLEQKEQKVVGWYGFPIQIWINKVKNFGVNFNNLPTI